MTGLRRGHLADLEVVEAILRTDPRERASGYDAEPLAMAEAVRDIIDNPDLHDPGSATHINREAEMKPTIGRIVIYRSRTGDYDVPAIVTATTETLNRKGVELGHIPDLTDDSHVHLTCFTAGIPGKRRDAEDFQVESKHGRSENVAGTYQEWDIPLNCANCEEAGEEPIPGTWRWPERV